MRKKFNDVGLCFPEDHFMGDISKKLAATYAMVEDGAYFIINRPRQYGKTTMLDTLANKLLASDDYMPFRMSFEGISDRTFLDESYLAPGFIRLMAKSARSYAPDKQAELLAAAPTVTNLDELSNFITDFVEKTDKKVVLMIDEVDKSSNNQLFVSFLGMLRDKYLNRKLDKTFHAVVLAGVHDVKSLKLKIRPESESKYNSPWNISTTFKIDMNLNPSEIKPMLEEYVQARSVKMDTQWVADRLFFFTSGYPYLVSKLCKIIDEDILPEKLDKEWTEDDVNQAFNLILRAEQNANFQTLVKNLEHYPELYELVYSMIFDSYILFYEPHNPVIQYGFTYGIFAHTETSRVVIHNKIYQERIANMMLSRWQMDNPQISIPTLKSSDFIKETPSKDDLDMQKMLVKIAEFHARTGLRERR